MASIDDFMNVFEASALLGIHDQTLRKLARQKKVPAFKVGKEWRFRKDALLRWTEEQQRPGAAPCSVLVVDDDEKTCKALARIVERFGCRVRQATGGQEGLQLVRQETPNMILLDLLMPDMNGAQFLAALRQTHPDLPVVIVTGYPDSELMKEAAQYAPLMLLGKPVEAEMLERTVRTLVGAKLAHAAGGER